MKVRYTFLDGLKTIICLFVFTGHYFVDFCIEDIFPLNSPLYRAGMLLLYGCYTVPLFCAISGFLAVQKRIEKSWELVLTCTNRFLRFELPIVFLIGAVMFLNKKGLFVWGDLLAQRLVNKQLALNYTYDSHYTWLFRKPFWELHLYDNPLWMIGSLFAGNILLYLFKYLQTLCQRFLSKWRGRAFLLLTMALFFFLSRNDIPLLATLLGGCYGLARQFHRAGQSGTTAQAVPHSGRQIRTSCLAYGILILLLVLNSYLYFGRNFHFEHFPRYYEWAGLATALGILHLTFTFHLLQNVLAAKPLTALSGLSFAIYIVHYPLIGLLSCPMIYLLWDRLPYVPLVLMTFAATSAVCFLLAFAYNRIVERPCYAVIRRVISFLQEN